MHVPFPSSLSSLHQEVLPSVTTNSKSISLSHVSQFKPLPSPEGHLHPSPDFSACTSCHPHFCHSTVHHLCIRKSDLFISRGMLSLSTTSHCILALRTGWPCMIWACPLLWFHLPVLPCGHSTLPWCMCGPWTHSAHSHFRAVPCSISSACKTLTRYLYAVPSNSDFSSLNTFSMKLTLTTIPKILSVPWDA